MEDRVSANQRIVKRRIIEAQGGAEVRRLDILYFVSRNGDNEHPHLIRIHHFCNNGVRLKDFKRWLGEVRGKDMPESFAWSYKRRYKTGYVWQDLLDDHLITPISNNEYILKGSEISLSITNNIDFSKLPMQKEQSSLQEFAADRQLEASSQSSMCVSSPKPSPEIKESSTTFGSEASSTLTDDSAKQDSEKNSDALNQEEVNSSASLSMPLLNTDKKWKTKKVDIINDNSIITSSNKPHFRKNRSSGMFWNLITCGADDTDESAVVITSKRSRPFTKPCSSHSAVRVKNSAKEIKGDFGEQRVPCAAYKPLYGPKCSQCGKRFRPEKLHSHMKSCKGIKALARGSTPALSAAENISIISKTSRNEDSISGYLLTR